jgi:Tol biopolymer transport system component
MPGLLGTQAISRLLTGVVAGLVVASCAATAAPSVPPAATPTATAPPSISQTTSRPSAASLSTPSVSPSVSSVKPTLKGSITFMRDDEQGSPQTWVACADLTRQRQLTSVAKHSSGWSVWSPDAARIAFDSDREDPDTADTSVINDVFTMAADGSDVRKVTDSVGESGDPAWSPDGTVLVFEADRGNPSKQGIYVARASDGSGLRRITTLPAGFSQDRAPRISPDGKQVLFTRKESDSLSALYVVNLDGSDLRRITSSELQPGDGTWSPDGTKIAFEAELVYDGRAGPWIVGSDGQGAKSLTGPQDTTGEWAGFSDPVWSPDGTLIMMLNGRHRSDGTASGGLATINSDGTGLAYVSDGKGLEHQPDWIAASC